MLLAAFCAAVWVAPQRFGAAAIRYVVLLMVLEFLVVHSAAFMGKIAVGPSGRAWRSFGVVGLGAGYSAFVAAFCLVFGEWWPLPAFWLLILNRLAGALLHRGEADAARALGLSWAAAIVAYIGAALLSKVLPIPRLGITPDIQAAARLPGAGVFWIEQPHRVLAGASAYFTLMACWEFVRHRVAAWSIWRTLVPGPGPRTG